MSRRPILKLVREVNKGEEKDLWLVEFDTARLQEWNVGTSGLRAIIEAAGGKVTKEAPGRAFFVRAPKNPIEMVEEQYEEIQQKMKPRFLTEEELDEIAEDLPLPLGVDELTILSVADGIKTFVKVMLSQKKISPLNLESLKEELIAGFERAQITPGSTVGMTAAEAIAGPVTQMALNTFQAAGTSKHVGSGVNAIRELLNVTPLRSAENMVIYFKEEFPGQWTSRDSFDRLLEKRRELTNLKLEQFVEKDFFFSSDDEMNLAERRSLIDDYFALRGLPQLPEDYEFLILPLNAVQMYVYRVSPYHLVPLLESLGTGSECYAVPTSLARGEMYVIANPNATLGEPAGLTPRQILQWFYQFSVVGKVPSLSLGGVPGITACFINKTPVLSLLRSVEKEGEGLYRGMINHIVEATSGVERHHLQALIEEIGGSVLEEGEDFVLFRAPDSPAKLVNQGIEAEIISHAHLWYLETNGSNLRGILRRPDVDQRFTTTNSPVQIYETYGIEAVRNFLFRDMSVTLGVDENYINSQNLLLLADHITCKGRPLGITYIGMQGQGQGPLASATSEKAIDGLTSAAIHGISEKPNSTSVSILLGKRAQFGTGMINLGVIQNRVQNVSSDELTQALQDISLPPPVEKLAPENPYEEEQEEVSFNPADLSRPPPAPRGEKIEVAVTATAAASNMVQDINDPRFQTQPLSSTTPLVANLAVEAGAEMAAQTGATVVPARRVANISALRRKR